MMKIQTAVWWDVNLPWSRFNVLTVVLGAMPLPHTNFVYISVLRYPIANDPVYSGEWLSIPHLLYNLGRKGGNTVAEILTCRQGLTANLRHWKNIYGTSKLSITKGMTLQRKANNSCNVCLYSDFKGLVNSIQVTGNGLQVKKSSCMTGTGEFAYSQS